MSVLAPDAGYRLWAPTYSSENAVTAIEHRLVEAMTPALAGKRLLDAGCGTGRRLAGAGAEIAVGVDLSPEMLAESTSGPGIRLMVGDVRALPLADCSFDVSWCRLVLGHLSDCVPAYAELARVTDTGGRVIVTDFHFLAHEAGHRRTFRLGDVVHELEHHVHDLDAHLAAAHAAGLSLAEVREGCIGAEVRGFYADAGKEALYERHFGLPVVLALSFTRDAPCGC